MGIPPEFIFSPGLCPHPHIGLGITLLLMLIHGTMTVMGIESSAAISGVAGLGHIIMTIGLGFFFAILFGSVEEHA